MAQKNKTPADLIITNASQLLTLEPRYAVSEDPDAASLGLIEDGAVAVSDGAILECAPAADIEARYSAKALIRVPGCVVSPGLVDCHTHLVFPATREAEFEMRNKGLSYKEITLRGGGIHASVRRMRDAQKPELYARSLPLLNSAMVHGTTTVEIKSGYGLTTDDEIKSLEVVAELGKDHPLDIVSTFLGAHEIPEEYRDDPEGYIRILIDEMMPEVRRRGLAEFCDIFCEEHVYNVEQSRRILSAAAGMGFRIKMHADELEPVGGAELAAELKAVSADHLVAASDEGIRAMAEAGVVPVLLPGTTFSLGSHKYARARDMIDAGLPVALATDFNPGTCFTESLQIIIAVACVYLKMTAAECIVACTRNAAKAVDREGTVGSLAPGKKADIVVWNIPDYRHIGYHFGVNLVATTLKDGKVVFSRRQ
ncbi:MAG: imidazolonepropionase [Planctomycetota bacterium]